MKTLPEQILDLLSKRPGLTDREIAKSLRGPGAPQQPINQAARALERKARLIRKTRPDNLIGNYLIESSQPDVDSAPPAPANTNHDVDALSEDEIKRVLVDRLDHEDWTTQVAWGRTPGIDVDARRGAQRWIIEIKGPGSRPQMRVNYFLGILGETLQRMDDPQARYSIALPDLKQNRGLWERLPELAKQRTGISLLLIKKDGAIEELM